ncbi:MAG: hypothetical protein ACKO72_07345 [Actinomycetes bacterium]
MSVIAPGRESVLSVAVRLSRLVNPASCTMSADRNANVLVGVSSIADWNAPSAISPSPVGSIPAITWIMSWSM